MTPPLCARRQRTLARQLSCGAHRAHGRQRQQERSRYRTAGRAAHRYHSNGHGDAGPRPVEGCLMSFAYWNPEMLRQTRLLNAQTGEIENVTITSLGEGNIDVRGTPTPATRYRVSGVKHPIELWYGADRAWVALQSTLDGGRHLRYQLK